MEASGEHAAAAEFDDLDDNRESIAWPYHAAELYFVESAKADDFAAEQVVVPGVEGSNLGSGLAHNDAGHQGHAGHVTGAPEFVVREVSVADADSLLVIVAYDGRELLHRIALRIGMADLLEIGNDVGVVDRLRIDNKIFASHDSGLRLGFHFLAAAFTGTTARGAFAVISFFDFATWLGHEVLLQRALNELAKPQILASKSGLGNGLKAGF